MAGYINMLKLCVGAEAVDDLTRWQASRHPNSAPFHVTRMWPKRANEILNGGSLYWVFKGVILARQRIIGMEERLGQDGITRCALVFDREVIRTQAMPKRPFQGWRYLRPEDAPPDLPASRKAEGSLPRDLQAALAEIGLR